MQLLKDVYYLWRPEYFINVSKRIKTLLHELLYSEFHMYSMTVYMLQHDNGTMAIHNAPLFGQSSQSHLFIPKHMG